MRLHASSGTTGKPIVVAYTGEDLDVWTEVMVRSFAICGLHAGDIIQNAYGYGLFTGGLGAHYGAEGLGATVIPISGGNTDRQIMVMRDFGVTAICCTPSYFLHLVERAGSWAWICARCPCAPACSAPSRGPKPCARASRSLAGIQAFDIYGLSEIIGPGRGRRVRAPGRPAHLRGPLLPGDRRPGDRRAAAGGRGRRTGADHAQQAGDADDPLPHARHYRADARRLSAAGARCGACGASAAAATTC